MRAMFVNIQQLTMLFNTLSNIICISGSQPPAATLTSRVVLQMEGGAGAGPGYPGYMPACTQTWNNNLPGAGAGHVQNSYSLAPHGQPSPLPPGPGGPQGGPGQAPVPSPLYPWMRSQFGESKIYHINYHKNRNIVDGFPGTALYLSYSSPLALTALL